MIQFRDKALFDLYYGYAAFGDHRIGVDDVLELLAHVGDTRETQAYRLEIALPGLSRARQVEIIRAGMRANEEKDLRAILAEAELPPSQRPGSPELDPEARLFILQVLGEAPVAAEKLELTLRHRDAIAEGLSALWDQMEFRPGSSRIPALSGLESFALEGLTLGGLDATVSAYLDPSADRIYVSVELGGSSGGFLPVTRQWQVVENTDQGLKLVGP